MGRADRSSAGPRNATWQFRIGIYDPSDLRATFVTAPLAGLPFNVPVLCPSDVTLNGDKLKDGTCLGYMNEPLHPNWRGQAAQGQCYVAVVTGMLGEGNACVRSIGSNEWVVPPVSVDMDTFAFRVSYLQNIDEGDRLCVTDKPRTDYDWQDELPAKPYTDCSSELAADPTWDASRWKTVTDNGNWK